jgi:hypothetical protein
MSAQTTEHAMSHDDLDDDLSDLLAGMQNAAPRTPVTPPASYVAPEKHFAEGCPKCRGTGKFISYSGRVLGDCFACKGRGQRTFKNSAADREQAREKAADRKARNLAADIAAFRDREPAVAAWLDAETAKAKPFGFAVAMVEALAKWGDLTDKQLETCQRLAAKSTERAAERAAAVTAAPVVDASKIEQAFATARTAADRPGAKGVMVRPIKLQSGEITVRFTPGSIGSQWEGMLFAKSGDKKLGSIKAGRFNRRFECTDAEAAAVLDCASNPEKAAVAYGKAWSTCGICGRGLLNDESIARGIGPICAERFGW